jgi:beta-glucosidase-like glycosyl hydrolase
MVIGTFFTGQPLTVFLEGPSKGPSRENSAPPKLQDVTTAVKEGDLGGVILFETTPGLGAGSNVDDIVEVVASIRQAAADGGQLPPFVCVDQDGGSNQNFRSPFTILPTNRDLGATGDEELAEQVGRLVGSELALVGVNVALAPTVDLRVTGASFTPFIGKRAYHADPYVVATMAAAFARGVSSTGVLAVAKHAPGHAHTSLNSHRTLAVIERSLAELEDGDLVPYEALIEAGVRILMAGHLRIDAVDSTNAFTQSPTAIASLLRSHLRFDGVVMSDDLDIMAGVNFAYDPATGSHTSPPTRVGGFRLIGDIVLQGLRAGLDIFLCQDRWREVRDALRDIGNRGEQPGATAQQIADRELIRAASARVASVRSLLSASWVRPSDLRAALRALQISAGHAAIVARVGRASSPTPALTAPPPDSSVDYQRVATVPFGLAPARLDAVQLERYIRHLGLEATFLTWRIPADDDLDPQAPGSLRARTLGATNAHLPGTVRGVLVRRSGAPALFGASEQVDTASFDGITTSTASQGSGEAPNDYVARMTASVFWDEDSRAVASLPLPDFPTETLLALWANRKPELSPPLPPLALAQPITGAFDVGLAAPPEYVFGATEVPGEGEVDPYWLRAPLTGRVRFERYRHLLATTSGDLITGPHSAAGRLVVIGSRSDLLPSLDAALPAASPFNRQLVLAFENVDGESVAEPLAALLWSQVLGFDVLMATERFTHDWSLGRAMKDQLARLLRGWSAWIGYWTYFTPVDGVPYSAPPGILDALPPKGILDTREVSQILAGIRADAVASATLMAFLRSVYAPLLAGAPWRVAGVDVTRLADAGFRAQHGEAAVFLEDFFLTPASWLTCFAGCPVGKPALAFRRPPPDWDIVTDVPVPPVDIVRSGWTTFDMEALFLAGKGPSVVEGSFPIDAASSAGLEPLDLVTLLGLEHFPWTAGRFAGVRLVPWQPQRPPYTTRQLLHDVTRGTSGI